MTPETMSLTTMAAIIPAKTPQPARSALD